MMMRPLRIILLALCSLCSCSPKVVKSYSSYFADYDGEVYSVHTRIDGGNYREFVYYYPDGSIAAEGIEKRVGKKQYRIDSFFRAYDANGKLLQQLTARTGKMVLINYSADETPDTTTVSPFLFESRSYYPSGKLKNRNICRMPDGLSFFGYYDAPAYGEHPARRAPAFPLHLGIYPNEQKKLSGYYPDIAECTDTIYYETGGVWKTMKNTGHIRFYDQYTFDEQGNLQPPQIIPDTMAAGPNWDNIIFWNASKPGYNVDSFVRSQLQYPQRARVAKVEGRVLVRVIVDKTGKIREYKVTGSNRVPVGYGLEEEALRIVSLLPDWQPPIHQAHSVQTYQLIPVVFKFGVAEYRP